MKNLLFALTAFSGLICPLRVFAAPVTINNPSFENQLISIDPPAQAWTDNLEPDWKETGGPNSPNAFMERLGLTGEDGTDTLGMVLGQDVWQDPGVSYEANKLYTLTVKVGNRSGSTAAGNQSVYGLANAAGQYLESRAVDASTFTPVGTSASRAWMKRRLPSMSIRMFSSKASSTAGEILRPNCPTRPRVLRVSSRWKG